MKSFKFLLWICGLVLILNVVFLLPLMNPNAGLVLTLGLGVILLVLAGSIKSNGLRSLKGVKKMIILGLVLWIALIFGLTIWIYTYGQIDTVTYEENALIVLGAGLRGDAVSLTLKHRLDSAYEYYLKNPKVIIVVSGGQGQGESVTEAFAMSKYLRERGVPTNQILMEESSTSTFENFVFSKVILENQFPDGYDVGFVSNDFHILRSQKIAKSVGLQATHIGATLDWYLVIVTYLRESLALVKWFVLGR